MKRETKFRGLRIDGSGWVYGDLVRIPHDSGDYNTPPSQELDTFITDSNVITHEWVLVDPETVGEWSGLSDKNGVEIYEGDICFAEIFYQRSANPDDFTIAPFKGLIEFIECCFMIKDLADKSTNVLCCGDLSVKEILGNIHRNPELLQP